MERGELVIRSESGLARVIAVMADGEEIEVEESVEKGVYRLKLNRQTVVSVILFDHAHNRAEIQISR